MKIPKKFFENYYYNFFDYHLIERKHVLIQQNEINDNVYVLRNGEYSMSFYGNIIDLNNVIILFKLLYLTLNSFNEFSNFYGE